VPAELVKLRIHEAYALPLSGWEPSSAGKPLEDGPGSETSVRTPKIILGLDRTTKTLGAIEVASRAGAGEGDKAPPAGLLDRYRRLAETLEAAVSKAQNDRDTPARDVAAIAQALARCLQHIGRLTGEGEITEAMIVKAPKFAKVLDVIREVGRRHKDAAREIFEGLSKLGGAS
jgi:hypothetical protein